MHRNSPLTLLAFVLVVITSMTGTADAQTTYYWDVDGIPGNEKIVSIGQTITVTYPTTGRVQTFPIANAYNNIQFYNLNGNPGSEILLTLRAATDGVPINSPTVTIINPVNNWAIPYNVGPWSDFLTGELNNQPGTDLAFHDAGDLFGGSNVTLLMRQNGVFETVPYRMPPGSFNNAQLVNTTILPVDQILLTERITSGGSINSPTVILLNFLQGGLNYYNVGTWTSFQVAELNGQAGSEIIFDNRNGLYEGNNVSILMRMSGVPYLYTFPSLTHFNNLQLLDDGQGGANIFLSNNLSLFGFPDNGPVVTVITPRTGTFRAYTVGYWISYAFKYVNGIAGQNVVFNTGYGTSETLYPSLGILK